jgi:hypothetical protein
MVTNRWAAVLGLMGVWAWAQEVDGGPVEFRAVEPEAITDVMREAALPEAAPPPMRVDLAEPPKQSKAQLALTQEETPLPSSPAPQVRASIHGSLRASYGGATEFPLDVAGTAGRIAPLMTRLRIGPQIDVGSFSLVMEADGFTGSLFGEPTNEVVGDRVTYPALTPVELRKFYLQYRWEAGVLRLGHQTSNWGLGLLANAGANDPEAGDFGQQQFGNLTWRALLAFRPFADLGAAWRAIEVVFAGDLVIRDTFGELNRGDRAWQAVMALRFAKDERNSLGAYAVYRTQRNVNVPEGDGGKATDVFVLDLAGTWELAKTSGFAITAGFEAVGITGTTTQARNEVASLLSVRQLGAAAKLKLALRRATFLVDLGYASADQNPGDDAIEAFRIDRDFKQGLVLFDHVLAYQSARSSVRASDPSVVGRPPEGADLIGTAGAITGAVYVFPRVKVALARWLDAYGGPLFAWSAGRWADPYASRIAGGTARNPFGGVPGTYFGTELCLGVQARAQVTEALRFSFTAEGGVLIPGNAFTLPTGGTMGTVTMARLRAGLSL